MRTSKSKQRILAVVTAFSIVLTLFLLLKASYSEELDIYEDTLRLHILANSNSEEDQSIKLTVRDKIIEHLSDSLNLCKTKAEAEALIIERSDDITELANSVLQENGLSQTARLTLTKEHYPERTYGELTLPAGTYTSVQIKLGNADGNNWWCVLFPQVCTDMATPANEKLAEAGFSANQIRLLTGEEAPEYKVKFKILEILSAFL